MEHTGTVLAFGEAMAMFVAETPGTLDQVERFHRRIAGADTNVAIGLARLGFPVRWLSRVGADSFGSFIRRTLEAEGVDCRHITVDPEHVTGLVFKERADEGQDPRVEYFRRGSAASRMSPRDAEDVDFSLVRHLHVTGIPPAISPDCHALTLHMMQAARKAGASISFDPNLRPSLWDCEQLMIDTLNDLAGLADWVLPGLAEGRRLSGLATADEIAAFYLERGAEAVIIKLGPEGSYYRGGLGGQGEDAFTVPGVPVQQVVDTVGAGDGFATGVISALLEGLSPREALLRGNLIGAQAVQVIGDMEGLPTRARLEELMDTGSKP
ncbi:2-dehydro-3-deoxygluconokinase [Modicisalibacter ilicicola DSM 19980]|uniref:2-dehydro-3-deoxygluconokinase n=1 Tax=Modicisalibacter ilicicola DSM 19980 TaxID=1121942 RepID=A0A1M4ZQV8_9GAMM|nr:sugar kinase [Halomonas ilicicola]SHF19936.1 2-dehydro-3-deoxygluconokinase [Halomonas ilicicola DSM 19980]